MLKREKIYQTINSLSLLNMALAKFAKEAAPS